MSYQQVIFVSVFTTVVVTQGPGGGVMIVTSAGLRTDRGWEAGPGERERGFLISNLFAANN